MHPHHSPLILRTCSICLRVLRRGDWISAEAIILEHRSYERAVPPRLKPALCAACEQSIYQRRITPAERVAA